MFSPLIDELMSALRCLPGVGPESAQRMVLQRLEHDRPGAQRLAGALTQAVEGVGRCERCRTLTEQPLCGICANLKRDQTLLCVVETPGDVLAIEQAGGYQGRNFVLLGRDRKSTRLNSSHVAISYAVFCLKKKNAENAGD